jgi:hypothetical protein
MALMVATHAATTAKTMQSLKVAPQLPMAVRTVLAHARIVLALPRRMP